MNGKFPLQELWLRLEANGYIVTPDTIIAVQKLLIVDDLPDLRNLPSLITPLLARNASEQQKVKSIVQGYIEEVESETTEFIQKEPVKPQNPLLEKIEAFWYKHERVLLTTIVYSILFGVILAICICGYNYKVVIEDITTRSHVIEEPSQFNVTVSPSLIKRHTIEWHVNSEKKDWKKENCTHVWREEGPHEVIVILKNKIGKELASDTIQVEVVCNHPGTFSLASSLEQRIVDLNTIGTFRAEYVNEFQTNVDDISLTYKWFVNWEKRSEQQTFRDTFDTVGTYEIVLKAEERDSSCGVIGSFQTSRIYTVGDERPFDIQLIPKAKPLPQSKWGWLRNLWMLLFPLLLVLLIEYGIKKREKKTTESESLFKGEFNKRPFDVEFEDKGHLLDLEDEFHRLAQMMRKQDKFLSTRIHPEKTAIQTARNAGYLSIQQKVNKLDKRFVMLIDRKSNMSHQVALFEELVTRLLKSRADIQLYYYDTNLSKLTTKENATYALATIIALNQDAHFVLFGNGGYFIKTLAVQLSTDRIAQFARLVQKKAIVTPTTIEDWSYKETLLKEEFITVPADLDGIELMVQALIEEAPVEEERIMAKVAAHYSVKYFDFNDVDELKEYLDDEKLFQWVCSIVVYPALNWSITVALGQALVNNYTDLVISYKNLLKLSRIKWLHDGLLRDRLRLKLLDELGEQNEIAVRTAILQLLEEVKAKIGPEATANIEWQAQHITNSFLLHAHDKDTYKSLAPAHDKMRHLWWILGDQPLKAYINAGESTLMPKPQKNGKHLNVKEYFSLIDGRRKQRNWLLRAGYGTAFLLTLLAAFFLMPTKNYNTEFTFLSNPCITDSTIINIEYNGESIPLIETVIDYRFLIDNIKPNESGELILFIDAIETKIPIRVKNSKYDIRLRCGMMDCEKWEQMPLDDLYDGVYYDKELLINGGVNFLGPMLTIRNKGMTLFQDNSFILKDTGLICNEKGLFKILGSQNPDLYRVYVFDPVDDYNLYFHIGREEHLEEGVALFSGISGSIEAIRFLNHGALRTSVIDFEKAIGAPFLRNENSTLSLEITGNSVDISGFDGDFDPVFENPVKFDFSELQPDAKGYLLENNSTSILILEIGDVFWLTVGDENFTNFDIGLIRLFKDSIPAPTCQIFNSWQAALNHPNPLEVCSLRVRENWSIIPPEIKQFTKLIYLDLAGNKIQRIENLDELTLLKHLSFGSISEGNQLTSMNGIENLVNLEKLDLDNNQISEISGLSRLTKLTKLDLDYNRIKEIKGIKHLPLEELFLSDNVLTEIGELATMPAIGNLDVSKNFIDFVTRSKLLNKKEDALGQGRIVILNISGQRSLDGGI